MPEHSTILIADDEVVARDTVAALLAAERAYRLVFADSGLAALDVLASTSVDLVLADVMMPGLDGFDLCRSIKAHASWRFVPVVLITALDAREDMLRGLEAGADEFLTKPVDKVVLRARVRVMLRIRHHFAAALESVPNLDALLQARRERLFSQAGLSRREREVLELVLLGRSLDDIGGALEISARTAKFHQRNLLAKLGAESRHDLMRILL